MPGVKNPSAADRVPRWVGWVTSAVCMGGFVLWARDQPTPHLPTGAAERLGLVVALLAYGVRALGFCERWHFLLRRQMPAIPRATGYRSAAFGELGNMLLPARAGDAIRVGVIAAPRPDISKRSILGTLLAERTLDVGCHMVILAIAMAGLFIPSLGPFGRLPIMVGVLGLACAALAGIYLGMTLLGARLPVARRLDFLAPIAVPVGSLKRDGACLAVALSAVMWTGEVAGWWAASHVVGLNLAPLQAAGVFSIAIFALAVPAGPGAVGALEAGVVLALHAIGAHAGPALSFVLLLRLLVLAPALLIAAALMIDTRYDWRLHRRVGLALHAKPPLAER